MNDFDRSYLGHVCISVQSFVLLGPHDVSMPAPMANVKEGVFGSLKGS